MPLGRVLLVGLRHSLDPKYYPSHFWTEVLWLIILVSPDKLFKFMMYISIIGASLSERVEHWIHVHIKCMVTEHSYDLPCSKCLFPEPCREQYDYANRQRGLCCVLHWRQLHVIRLCFCIWQQSFPHQQHCKWDKLQYQCLTEERLWREWTNYYGIWWGYKTICVTEMLCMR